MVVVILQITSRRWHYPLVSRNYSCLLHGLQTGIYLCSLDSLLCANSIYLCSSLDSFLCANSSNALIFSFLYVASTFCLILKCRRFVRRGFSECSIESIPEQRRKRINLSRGSKYYIKQLQPKPAGVNANNFVIRWLSTHGAWCHLRRY
jgi:hypothetical protein